MRKLDYKVIYHGETDAFEFTNNRIYDVYLDNKGRKCIFMGDGDEYYGFKEDGEFEVVSKEQYRELKKLPKYQKHICPVCGKGIFSMQESGERCEVCGWSDSSESWLNLGLTVDKCKELYQQGKLAHGWEYVREMVKEENQGSHACPICWKTRFSKWDSKEKCPHCGWIDDWVQDKYEDRDGMNKMCRRDYCKAYKQGTLRKIR